MYSPAIIEEPFVYERQLEFQETQNIIVLERRQQCQSFI